MRYRVKDSEIPAVVATFEQRKGQRLTGSGPWRVADMAITPEGETVIVYDHEAEGNGTRLIVWTGSEFIHGINPALLRKSRP